MSLLMLAALGGCGKAVKSLSPVPEPPPAAKNAAPQSQDRMTMRDLQLFQYDRKSVGEQPRIEITADTATMPQDETWAIEGAKATIHTATNDEIRLRAAKGTVDQRKDRESAFLQGGVVMETKDSTFEMQSAQWSNQEGVVKTDEAVSISSRDIQMNAASLIYYPDEDRLLLTNASGTINLKGSDKP